MGRSYPLMLRLNCYWKAVFVVSRILHRAACLAGLASSSRSVINQCPCIALGLLVLAAPVARSMSFDARIQSLFSRGLNYSSSLRQWFVLSDNDHGQRCNYGGVLKLWYVPFRKIILIKFPFSPFKGCALADTPGFATAMLVHMEMTGMMHSLIGEYS